MFEYAGICGLNPSELWRVSPELTLRELFWMTWSRRRDQWDHTAALRGHMANMFRGEGTRPVHPWAYHPLREIPVRKKKSGCTVAQLTAAFVGI